MTVPVVNSLSVDPPSVDPPSVDPPSVDPPPVDPPPVDPPPVDPWAGLRATTRARIGLGRAGDGLPTRALLDFQLAHARARDAVHGALDVDGLGRRLAPLPILHVRSLAPDRAAYIRRPDLGRRLHPSDEARLRAAAPVDGHDAVFILADGLSPAAVVAHGPPVIAACLQRLPKLRLAPIILAEQARVALADGVGQCLGARLSVILIGERPGLSIAESLGIYITWAPRIGRSDAERNCISNIHDDGLTYDEAAATLAWLMNEATRRGLSGVQLKDGSSNSAIVPIDRGPAMALLSRA